MQSCESHTPSTHSSGAGHLTWAWRDIASYRFGKKEDLTLSFKKLPTQWRRETLCIHISIKLVGKT